VSTPDIASGRSQRPIALALVCLALGAGATGAAGCGDDEPEATTPTTEPITPTGPTGPTSGDEPRDGQEGGGDVDLEDGTVTPPPETDPDNLPEDSPQNDTPPPPGSAAEEFEQFCDENPEACG
jgi:hypothetical protein